MCDVSVVAFIGQAHFGCDALWKEYMWKFVESYIWGERHIGCSKGHGRNWHLASPLVATSW